MNCYDGLSQDSLHKIYRKKIDQLIYAREHRNSQRENDIIREMAAIEERLGMEQKPKKKFSVNLK